MATNPLIGTWKLISYYQRDADGGVHYVWGRRVSGYISYTEQGRMSVVITAGDRPRASVAGRTDITPEEKAAAYDTCIAYAGTYDFHGDRVDHHVEASLFPNWVGGDQVRFVRLEGDRLSLTTPPMPAGATTHTGHLEWVRV